MNDTAQIIVTLGVPFIGGLFAWLSRRETVKAKMYANNAKNSADVAVRASLRTSTRYSEFDLPPDSKD